MNEKAYQVLMRFLPGVKTKKSISGFCVRIACLDNMCEWFSEVETCLEVTFQIRAVIISSNLSGLIKSNHPTAFAHFYFYFLTDLWLIDSGNISNKIYSCPISKSVPWCLQLHSVVTKVHLSISKSTHKSNIEDNKHTW